MTDARGERVDTCVYLTGANWLVRFLVLMNVQQEEMERKNGQHRESDAWGVGTCAENMTEWQTTWCTLDELFLHRGFPTLKATKMNHCESLKYFASRLPICYQILIFTAVRSADGRFQTF